MVAVSSGRDDVDTAGEERNPSTEVDQRSLLWLASLLTGNRPDAEDLVQAAMLKYYETVARQAVAIGSPTAYARQIVSSEFLSGRRRVTLWNRTAPLLPGQSPYGTTDSGTAIVQRDWIRSAVIKLPAKQRLAVALRFYQDLTYDDISIEMGIPKTTARSLVHRGLRKLRIELEGDDEQ